MVTTAENQNQNDDASATARTEDTANVTKPYKCPLCPPTSYANKSTLNLYEQIVR